MICTTNARPRSDSLVCLEPLEQLPGFQTLPLEHLEHLEGKLRLDSFLQHFSNLEAKSTEEGSRIQIIQSIGFFDVFVHVSSTWCPLGILCDPIAWWTLQNHHFGQSQLLELRPPSMSCWPKLVGVSKNSSQRRTKETQINKIPTFYASLTIKQSYIINGSVPKEMPIFLWYCWFRNQPDDTVDTVGSGNPRLLPCFTGVQKHPKWLAGPPDEVSLGVWG